MGAMEALPQEVLVQSVAGFLGLRELTRLHMTCKVCNLKQNPALSCSGIGSMTIDQPKADSNPPNNRRKQTFTLWLDDTRAWAHIPWLDLSYQSLAVRRSRSGRICVQPMNLTMLEVMRVVGQGALMLMLDVGVIDGSEVVCALRVLVLT